MNDCEHDRTPRWKILLMIGVILALLIATFLIPDEAESQESSWEVIENGAFSGLAPMARPLSHVGVGIISTCNDRVVIAIVGRPTLRESRLNWQAQTTEYPMAYRGPDEWIGVVATNNGSNDLYELVPEHALQMSRWMDDRAANPDPRFSIRLYPADMPRGYHDFTFKLEGYTDSMREACDP